MKNKSILLNILLAAIIVVLTFQLMSSEKQTSSRKEYSQKNKYTSKHYEGPKDVKESSLKDDKISIGPQIPIMAKPVLVIGSYDSNEQPDIMTVAWAGIASSDPLCIAVSIRPSRKTFENIVNSGYFTVNIPSEINVSQVDYIGNISGRDENKFEKLGLTPIKGEYINAPYVKEFPIALECKIIDTLNLGSHVQFIGQVIDTKADADMVKENKLIKTNKIKPIIFELNSYYGYGKNLGKPFDLYKTITDTNMTKTTVNINNENETLTTIFNRKSVRHYTEQKISKEQLELLVKAGMAAPTAADKRPWAFIAITDRETLNALAETSPYAKVLKKAPAAIAVCGDLNKTLPAAEQPFWIQDCSAASENILLTAESIGLGAVWTGVFPMKEREEAVRKILTLPNHIIPLNIIAIGYPTGEETPKNKWDESNLHWDKW